MTTTRIYRRQRKARSKWRPDSIYTSEARAQEVLEELARRNPEFEFEMRTEAIFSHHEHEGEEVSES